MDAHSIYAYVMPPLLGITIGVIWSFIGRHKYRARLAIDVAAQLAEIRHANEQLLETNRQLVEEAITDPLTGVLNRRFLTSHLAREAKRILRLRESKGAQVPGNVLLVVDIDDFKDFNDRYGHVRGDQVLVRFAEILKESVRESDYVVRWGGEEFVVLATDVAAQDCEIIAERILASVRAYGARLDAENERPISCSIGVSHFPFFPDHARVLDWQQVLQIADVCSYVAKRNGKDGWVLLRGRHYDSGFRYAELLDSLSSTPDQLFLDDKLVMRRSLPPIEDPTVPAERTEVSIS